MLFTNTYTKALFIYNTIQHHNYYARLVYTMSTDMICNCWNMCTYKIDVAKVHL